MAKLSIDEFKNKYNEKIIDNDDLLIEIFEDVTDSFSPNDDEYKRELEEKDKEIARLKTEYKERFLTSDTDAKESKEENKTLEEKKIIDIREI